MSIPTARSPIFANFPPTARPYSATGVAAALEARIRAIAEQIRHAPESAPRVDQRPGVRVVPLVCYPYKIFYRIFDDSVRILHIRHTSRRPWNKQ